MGRVTARRRRRRSQEKISRGIPRRKRRNLRTFAQLQIARGCASWSINFLATVCDKSGEFLFRKRPRTDKSSRITGSTSGKDSKRDYKSCELSRRSKDPSEDVVKAFDRAWKDGHTTPPDPSPRIRDRTFQVRIKEAKSSTRTAEAGVPQGAALFPTMFNVYVAVLPTHPASD